MINIDENVEYYDELLSLSASDLVVALFVLDTYVVKGVNRVFSPFNKPKGLKAKYAFIRLSIDEKSLLEGLATPLERIYETIDKFSAYKSGSVLRVTNPTGTDINLTVKEFTTCQHRITGDSGMVFLTPSEISAEVISNTANGKIVVVVTVGQLYKYGELLGQFGLVDAPVTFVIENGMVADIYGGSMAVELKEKPFALEEPCRVLVELGHGLSKMTPTWLIGIDESIIDTCHFGIGDSSRCGVHLDLVVGNPKIFEV